MSSWEESQWESSIDSAASRAQRRSGPYRRFVPDLLDGAAIAVDGDLARRITTVERGVRSLDGPGAEELAGVARFLLRSEAIASSLIEGIAPSAQQVALAELGQSETVRGLSEQAKLVADNVTLVRRSTTELVTAESITVDHVVDLHRSLLQRQPQHHGLRTQQNWIGGSSRHPLDAQFVPPAPERVPGLMHDLVAYLNGSAHSVLVQAALVHAQFETIHPFTDGNGRVGRALIHTVLARRGLAEHAVLPVSLVLATFSGRYVDGLTRYREESAGDWLTVFVDAVEAAVAQSRALRAQLQELAADWAERVSRYRTSQGKRAAPRADSATARLLTHLPEAPVVTATTLARILGVSFPAASAALDELRQAGILHTKSIDRGATAFIARDVLDLITVAERQLASTRFDTRASAPDRPVPAPQGRVRA
jgi:Fic family protein